MFTGLVEKTGTIAAIEPRGGGVRLRVIVGTMAAEVAHEDSIAVNGCCLTVTSADVSAGEVSFDLLEQTLRVTSLGQLREGSKVNLERALAAGARLGGHFVQGHVDDTVEVLFWGQDGTDYRLEVSLPQSGKGLVIPKGSICLDGISLTAAQVTDHSVTCWIIPHTLEMTSLSECRAGQRLNVEWDMLGKYVQAFMAARG